ncbi:MAG: hypothetical protein CME06_13425 [Gemmatimonadetes bacterium]|nr:hypothetical protein [Gemmatimonadota bacterium]
MFIGVRVVGTVPATVAVRGDHHAVVVTVRITGAAIGILFCAKPPSNQRSYVELDGLPTVELGFHLMSTVVLDLLSVDEEAQRKEAAGAVRSLGPSVPMAAPQPGEPCGRDRPQN